MSPEINPYAAPQGELSPLVAALDDADPEQVRNRYLAHEASVRSIGLLYYVGGFIATVGAVVTLGLAFAPRRDPPIWFFLAMALVYAVCALLGVWAGSGLRRLRAGARTPAAILAGLGLVSVPLGTIIGAYCLWLLYSQQGKVVFSPEYREVVRRTPRIHCPMSAVVWVLLAGLLGLAAIVTGWLWLSSPVRLL